MTQRIFLMAAAVIFLVSTTSLAQEKQDSPASPSDIPVEQIKKETGSSQNNTPKPVAEGTPVAQPGCQNKSDECGCKIFKPRCGNGWLKRIRSMLARCCGS